MPIVDTLAALVLAGFIVLVCLLVYRRRRRRTQHFDVQVPLTWCGNCGQPTSALCHEHKKQAAEGGKQRHRD